MKLPSFPVLNGKNPPEDDFNPFPDLPPKKTHYKVKTEYVVLSLALAIFFVSFSLFITKSPQTHLFDDNNSQQAQAAPTPTPKPLPTGQQVYNYSHGSQVVGPKPTQAIIDPIDPKIGDTQTFTLKVPHENPITSTQAFLITDNQTQELTLTNSSTDLWTTKWKMKDTYSYKYQVRFSFSDESETFTGALTFR